MRRKYLNKKHTVKAVASSLLIASFCIAEALPAAASPEFARTEEEWARLRDDKLEWDEIADLVHEYNATVKENERSYQNDERDLVSAEDVRESLIEQADDYDNMAADLAGVSESQAASYRALAAQTRAQAEESVTDRSIIRRNYDSIEASIVLNTKTYFLNYYSAIESQKKAAASYELTKLSYNSTQNLFNVGMATDVDVMSAKEAMQTAEAATFSADAAVTSARKLLITNCGWSYESEPEIGELPELDLAAINSIDLSADMTAALENNYTLLNDRQMLANTSSANNYTELRTRYQDQLDTDTDQVRSSVRSAYDDMMIAKASYDNSSASRQLSEDSFAATARNYELGIVSKTEYDTAAYELESLRYDEEIARIALLAAYVNYQSYVDGLASAGTS